LGGQAALYVPGLATSFAVVVFFSWFGIRRFRLTEKTFADMI
jgi:lipopolysaccharide transport system permease protein